MNKCTRICAMNDPDKGCLLGLGDNCTVGPDKEYRPATVESGSVCEKLAEHLNRAQEIDTALRKEVNKLRAMLSDMRNELCELCGKYRMAHEGACDGCRWKEC